VSNDVMLPGYQVFIQPFIFPEAGHLASGAWQLSVY